MKYSMEADKYRAAYMPPSSLAMSMYSDPKYLDSSPKYSYLDSAKAYQALAEQSKLYMDQQQKQQQQHQQQQQQQQPDYNRSSYEPNKLYDDSSPGRSPAADSPDNQQQPKNESSTSSPSPSLSSYYPQLQAPQMGQYPGYQAAGNEGFRRPLAVIIWPEGVWAMLNKRDEDDDYQQ